jgi:predicted nucleotide-binding protein
MSEPTRLEITQRIIKNQLESLKIFEDDPSDKLEIWKKKTIRLLQGKVRDEELSILNEINENSYDEDYFEYFRFLGDLQNNIEELPGEYLIDHKEESKAIQVSKQKRTSKTDNIFIVHGQDEIYKLEVARVIEKIGLSAIVLHEQPNQGRTIIEKFEDNAATAGFAVILLTPDDIGYPINKEEEKKPRARQNVILELGYFCGLLDRKRVCVLYKGDVEIPSDYLGVVYIKIDEAGSWKFSLSKEFKEAGFTIDMNKLV